MVGVRGMLPFTFDKTSGSVQASVGYVHDFEDDAPIISAAFTGAPGSTSSIPTDDTDENYFEVGVGLLANITDKLDFTINYQGILGADDFTRHGINASLHFQF